MYAARFAAASESTTWTWGRDQIAIGSWSDRDQVVIA